MADIFARHPDPVAVLDAAAIDAILSEGFRPGPWAACDLHAARPSDFGGAFGSGSGFSLSYGQPVRKWTDPAAKRSYVEAGATRLRVCFNGLIVVPEVRVTDDVFPERQDTFQRGLAAYCEAQQDRRLSGDDEFNKPEIWALARIIAKARLVSGAGAFPDYVAAALLGDRFGRMILTASEVLTQAP